MTQKTKKLIGLYFNKITNVRQFCLRVRIFHKNEIKFVNTFLHKFIKHSEFLDKNVPFGMSVMKIR